MSLLETQSFEFKSHQRQLFLDFLMSILPYYAYIYAHNIDIKRSEYLSPK